MGESGDVVQITVEDIRAVWSFANDYLAEILNGEYSVEDARRDILSLVGSAHDHRADMANGGGK